MVGAGAALHLNAGLAISVRCRRCGAPLPPGWTTYVGVDLNLRGQPSVARPPANMPAETRDDQGVDVADDLSRSHGDKGDCDRRAQKVGSEVPVDAHHVPLAVTSSLLLIN